jgi:hypothetical protein
MSIQVFALKRELFLDSLAKIDVWCERLSMRHPKRRGIMSTQCNKILDQATTQLIRCIKNVMRSSYIHNCIVVIHSHGTTYS